MSLLCAILCTKAAGDFLLDLGHTHRLLSDIVGERVIVIGRKTPPDASAACLKHQESVVLCPAGADFAELLPDHLPPPCRLLALGLGLPISLAQWHAAGFIVTEITSENSEQLSDLYARLQGLADQEAQWDALLLQKCTEWISPLDLMINADRLLAQQGDILVIDRFALQRSGDARDQPYLLHSFIDLARRFGFRVTAQVELHQRGMVPTDFTLRRTPSASEKNTDYFLLRFSRTLRPRWRIDRIDARNSASMRVLFNEVYGHPMSDSHWRWKYREGKSAAIGIWEEDRLIAHYGGVARDILYFGQPRSASQIGDLMVAPAGRGTLSRRGPLFLAIATFVEDQVGYGNPHLLGVGCPNMRHWKIAKRLGLYDEPVGHMLELYWPAAPESSSFTVAVRPLELECIRDRAEANACWHAMREDLCGMIVGVRDAEVLHHRYVAHPEKNYRLFVLRRRWGGRALGLFVLNPDAEGGCELMDAIGSLRIIPQIVAHARRAAAGLGANRLFCWAIDNIRDHFGPAQARDLEVVVPTNGWTPGPPPRKLSGKWWLTGGDTDFR